MGERSTTYILERLSDKEIIRMNKGVYYNDLTDEQRANFRYIDAYSENLQQHRNWAERRIQQLRRENGHRRLPLAEKLREHRARILK